MKYIINESQYGLIISEQSVIDVNAFKQDLETLTKQYCKPVSIDQNIFNDSLIKVQEQIKETVNRKFEQLQKEIKSSIFNKIIVDIQETIKSFLIQKVIQAYKAQFGLQQPIDYLKTVNELFNLVFTKIYEKLDGNLLYKGALKIWVNKKNLNSILSSVEETLSSFVYSLNNTLRYLIVSNPYMYGNIVAHKSGKKTPCTKLRVVVNDKGTKLKPNEYYNPPSPVTKLDVATNINIDIDSVSKPYIEKILTFIKGLA